MMNLHETLNERDGIDNALLQAEVVLPVQFHGTPKGTAAFQPVRRLMLAMLADAIRCFRTNSGARQPVRRRDFAEAQSWIFSDKDDGFFSFNAVCDALEIDPKAVRKMLVRSNARNLAAGSNVRGGQDGTMRLRRRKRNRRSLVAGVGAPRDKGLRRPGSSLSGVYQWPSAI
jgi:hypothetical protein